MVLLTDNQVLSPGARFKTIGSFKLKIGFIMPGSSVFDNLPTYPSSSFLNSFQIPVPEKDWGY